MALQSWNSMSLNCLAFHTSAAFLFLIFLSTESSSSCVNGPSLMSNCLLIILVIGSCITFRGFPSKFLKCCFHSCIHSCWLVAFSLAFTLLFFLLTSFSVCYAILDCLLPITGNQSNITNELTKINSTVCFKKLWLNIST